MQKRNTRIDIPTPCKQTWESMQTMIDEKFCLQCSKTVIDMTDKTATEILILLKNQSNGLCARVKQSTLNDQVSSNTSTRIPFIYRTITVVSLIGISKLTCAHSSNSPLTEYTIPTACERKSSSPLVALEKVNEQTDTLSGYVMEANSKVPLQGVQVILKKTDIATSTDAEGRFSLIIPKNHQDRSVDITLMYIGYQTQAYSFAKDSLPFDKKFSLHPDEDTLIGEVIIMKAKRWWQFWR